MSGRSSPTPGPGGRCAPSPGRRLAADDPHIDAILESGRSRIRQLGETADAVTALQAIVTATADAALEAARGITPAAALDPAAEMERSLDVAAGRIRPDPAWALGHVWRGVYPAIVTRFSGRGWAPGEALRFRRLSAEMERVAFGPAPVNTAKILALIDAGRINLGHLREPRIGRVDAVVDAVLPPPGARGLRSPLLEQLVRDGHARVVAGGRGLEVTADAACVGRGGSPSPGLSAIGRPTEDSVIGNDTLNRALHPQADRWAAPRRSARRDARERWRDGRRPAIGLCGSRAAHRPAGGVGARAVPAPRPLARLARAPRIARSTSSILDLCEGTQRSCWTWAAATAST